YSRDENARRFCMAGYFLISLRQWLNFLGRKEEAMPRLSHEANVAPGIVIDDHANVNPAVIVLLNRFDDRGFVGKRNVHHIAAGPRPQPHPAPRPDPPAPEAQLVHPV